MNKCIAAILLIIAMATSSVNAFSAGSVGVMNGGKSTLHRHSKNLVCFHQQQYKNDFTNTVYLVIFCFGLLFCWKMLEQAMSLFLYFSMMYWKSYSIKICQNELFFASDSCFFFPFWINFNGVTRRLSHAKNMTACAAHYARHSGFIWKGHRICD